MSAVESLKVTLQRQADADAKELQHLKKSFDENKRIEVERRQQLLIVTGDKDRLESELHELKTALKKKWDNEIQVKKELSDLIVDRNKLISENLSRNEEFVSNMKNIEEEKESLKAQYFRLYKCKYPS